MKTQTSKTLFRTSNIAAILALASALGAIGPTAHANSELLKSTLEAQPHCGNFVRFDKENLYQGFGSYRKALEEPREPIPGKFRVSPLQGNAAYELSTLDSAIDMVTEGSTAYVLTYSAIEEWDLQTKIRKATYATYAIRGSLAYKQHAEAFARYKDKLILAHGRLGVSFFNLQTKRLTNQFRLVQGQLPLESMATGVTIQGHYAYVVMDNFHVTRPEDKINIFRGIIVIDMESESVVAALGGMDPGTDSITSDSKSLIVSFGGIPIWKYRIDDITKAFRGNKLPEPEYRLWKFPVKGHPIGAASMDENNYYTCYLKAPSYRGENGGFYRKVPMALDRRMLLLD